jgi:hypothetical protein
MSPLAFLKAIACLVVDFLSPVVSQAFLFPMLQMSIVSGRSKLMRVGHHTGILRLGTLMDGILF